MNSAPSFLSRRSRLATALVMLLAPACEPHEEADLCGAVRDAASTTDASRVAIVIEEVSPGGAVDGPIVVRGSAVDTLNSNIAIQRIVVGGRDAESQSFNFSSWSAELPYERVLGLPATMADPNVVMLDVVAYDACSGGVAGRVTREIPVVRRVVDRVQQLTLVATVPGAAAGGGYLPASGNTSARIEVRANVEAAGATVQLRTTRGTIDPTTVVLQRTDDAAIATATLTVREEGDAVVTAQSGLHNAAVSVRVAAAPRVLPSLAMLAVDQSASLEVVSNGNIEQCQATPATGFTATMNGMDLMAGAVAPASPETATSAQIVVRRTATAVSGTRVVVSCQDRFGQTGRADVVAE